MEWLTETISSFVVPARRARLLGLASSDRGRTKLRAALPHFQDFDPRFARRLSPSEQGSTVIAQLLRDAGAGPSCNVFSESPDRDAVGADLEAILGQLVGGSVVALVVCLPGRLAYFESEEPGERYLLKRG